MQIGLYESVSGMKVQSVYQDTLSTNLSRMNFPGNKRMITAFELPPESDLEKASKLPGTTTNIGVPAAPLTSRSVIDFASGSLDATGNPTDFAIEHSDNTFIKVRDKQDNILYSRNGQFRLDPNGYLVNGNGDQVLLDSDAPVNLDPKKDKGLIKIDPEGQITAGPNNTKRGTLGLVHTDNPQSTLIDGGAGRFKLADPAKTDLMQDGLAPGGEVRQGSLEQSNANSLEEMVSLVQVVRSYEANQKALMAQDGINNQIIQSASATS